MPYPLGLEELQWAREATPGTDLATTSKILVTSFNVTPASDRYAPEALRGLIQRNRGFETPMKRSARFSMSGPVSYEQLQNWMNYALINVASPTGSGPYTWTHTRNPAVMPTPATFTLERKEYDGSTAIGQAWHYCMVDKFTLNFADGQPLMFTAEGFCRRVQTETLTAGQSLPSPEIPPTALATAFIDTSFAGLGGTQVSNQVLGAKLEIMTGVIPIWTLDGRTDLDYSAVGHDAKKVGINLEMTCLLGAQYATEKSAAEAQTLRAIQLAIAGSSSRAVTLGGIFKYETPELFELGESDGQKTVVLKLAETSDGTNLFKAVVTNNVSALA